MTRRRPGRVRLENLEEGPDLLSRLFPVAHLHGDLSVTPEEAPPDDHALAARHHRARLGTPIPFGVFAAPRLVEVRGERLVWRDLGPGSLPDSEGLLGRFVALRDAPPEQIADFARLYGVLAICEHGHPAPHVRTADNGSLIACSWQREGDGGGVEPLAAWRALAQKATSLLDEMAHNPDQRPLHVGRVGWGWLRPAQVTLGVDGGEPCFSSLAGDGLPFG